MNDEVEAGPMCTGDCDDDSDCDAGLLCYQRDFYYNTPPGCRPQVSANECENALNECDVVDKGATRTNLDSHPYSYVLDRAQIRIDVIVTTLSPYQFAILVIHVLDRSKKSKFMT
eukprot:COSAG04_NODE_341_length_16294_cov_8.682618_5_plen_115_part_00